MRHFGIPTSFLFITLVLFSCITNKTFIEKQQTEFGTVKFYAVNVISGRPYVDKLYAATDSNGVKRFYSFYPDRIVMTDERAKQLSYTVIFSKLTDNFDGNNYQRCSTWDNFVFSKAMTILKISKYSHLKSPDNATGYEIEINYLHGFPKDKMFEPL